MANGFCAYLFCHCFWTNKNKNEGVHTQCMHNDEGVSISPHWKKDYKIKRNEARVNAFALVWCDCVFIVMFWYNSVGCRLHWSIVQWNVENVKIISMFVIKRFDVNVYYSQGIRNWIVNSLIADLLLVTFNAKLTTTTVVVKLFFFLSNCGRFARPFQGFVLSQHSNCKFYEKIVCILTGLTNLSSKYFFILLQRNQWMCTRFQATAHCFWFASANWLYQKKKTKRNEIFPYTTFYPIIGCVGFVTRWCASHLRKGYRI